MSGRKVRFISKNSRSHVSHRPGCRYLRAIPEKNMLELSAHEAEKRGYRPCKCCNCMSFRFRQESRELQKYAEQKKLKLVYQPRFLFVQTPEGLWKICYAVKEQKFVLYHGNKPYRELPASQLKQAFYHRQTDELTSDTIMGYLMYIYKHDNYRQRVAQAGGNERAVNIAKKYARQRDRRLRREQQNRLAEIFAGIERKNPEYAKLACR